MADGRLEIPMELVDKHIAAAGAATEEAPKPAVAAAPPEDAPEDNLETGSEDADEDKDAPTTGDEPDDEERGEEPEEEAEGEGTKDEETTEDDDEPSPEEEELEDVLEKVSAADLKRIEDDPTLKKLHLQMQRGFTHKMQDVSARERAVETHETGLEELRTPDGMATYLKDIFETHGAVVGRAFEAVAAGENGEAFLVEIGRTNPGVFEKAYERVQELLADPEEMKRHQRKVDLDMKDADISAREEVQRREAFDTDFMDLAGTLETEAKKLGVREGDDLAEVKQRLVKAVAMDARGRIALTHGQVKKIVAETKAEQNRRYDRVRKQLDRDKIRTSQDKTKRMAATAKEPARVVPRGTPRQPTKVPENFTPTPGGNGLREFIDQALEKS